MKIVWIEDFGDVPSPSELAGEMFKELIQNFGDLNFGTLLNPDDKLISWSVKKRRGSVNGREELARLFRENTTHEIMLCYTYGDWEENFNTNNGDFDIVIIDINLSSGAVPEERPDDFKDMDDFDKKAGFYIYHQLIKQGFPANNIVFMTGEIPTHDKFEENRKKLLLDKLHKVCEKNDNGYVDFRNWLHGENGKTNDPYITLRRGIIEGCQEMKRLLAKKSELELTDFLLFFKSTNINLGDEDIDSDGYVEHIETYLEKLIYFFTVKNKRDHAQFTLFLKEMAAEWEMSQGYLKHVNRQTLEGKFKDNCHAQMKCLRNWTAHGLLPKADDVTDDIADVIKEKEKKWCQLTAYLFMIGMRAMFDAPIDTVYRYERILATLFDPEENFEAVLGSNDRDHKIPLAHSYAEIYQKLAGFDIYISHGKQFKDIVRTYGDFPRFKRQPDKKRDVRDNAIQLLYQSFWHGVIRCSIRPDQYADPYRNLNLQVKFWYESMPKESFPYFLGKLIMKSSFKQV